MPIERKKEIVRRRKRKAQLKKYKEMYAQAKDAKSKEILLEKIRRRQPFFTGE